MNRLTVLGAAIAASLAGSGAAFALAPADDSVAGNYDVRLVLSGSSAFQAAIENELSRAGSGICNTSGTTTYNRYTTQAGPPAGPGLLAYSCTLVPGLISGGGGERALIYFRTEGGSVYGVTPIARPATQPLRLVVNGACSAPAPGASGTCAVNGYNAVSDTFVSGNAVAATSQLGVSDEEPAVFAGENYPDNATASKLQPPLSSAERSTLTGASTALIGQAFGVYVNTTADPGLTNLTSLSRTTIASIFQGNYNDWSQVPKNDGSNTSVVPGGLPITLCKRESGSGTQVAASIYFNNFGCGQQYAFATTASPGNLNAVVENNTTGLMRSCISNNGSVAGSGAIGFIVGEADAAGRKQIKVDQQGAPGGAGLAPLAAASDYQFWYEATANKGSAFSGAPAATQTLGNKLISVLRVQATAPNSAAVVVLPGPNVPSFPIATPAGRPPIAIATHNKNSCLPLSNQN